MDLSCKEDVDIYYKLFYRVEALYIISNSDAIKKYYENLCEMSETLYDSYYDNEYREDLLQRIVDVIDDYYVSIIKELVGGDFKMNSIEQYSILEIYKLLCNFCAKMKLDEKTYRELLQEIAVYEIAIGSALYEKIVAFCETIIEPEIDKDLAIDFSVEEAEEIEGMIHLKSEAAEKKLMKAYIEQLLSLDDKIREFGMDILKPYLVA